MALFDTRALESARQRARRRGGSFLDDRIWTDIEETVGQLRTRPSSALLLGPVTVAAQLFAQHANLALTTEPDRAAEVDMLLAVRWAETEDDLPEKLAALAHIAPPDTPLVGASLGGDSLAALRTALVAADAVSGTVVPRAHPRLEPAAFAELLQRCGFIQPVVDVDRVEVRYSSLRRLVDDLRDLGASNILEARPRKPPARAWRDRLEDGFPPATVERFDVLHFLAWTAPH